MTNLMPETEDFWKSLIQVIESPTPWIQEKQWANMCAQLDDQDMMEMLTELREALAQAEPIYQFLFKYATACCKCYTVTMNRNELREVDECIAGLTQQTNFQSDVRVRNLVVLLYTLRGVVNDESGDHNQAITDFNNALQLSPQDPNALHGRANSLFELDRVQEALVDLNQALQIDPDDEESYALRGHIQKGFGNYQQAIEDYTKALSLDPEPDADTLRGRADCYRALNMIDAANRDDREAAMIEDE